MSNKLIGGLGIMLLLGGVVFMFSKTLPNDRAEPTPLGNDNIRVSMPLENSVIASPVTIRGEARGNWYFEASFPIKLLDGNSKELAIAPAQAQGEWMTTEFVPFELSLSYPTPATEIGTLVLMKDNPSGLPEHDDRIIIPVRFKK